MFAPNKLEKKRKATVVYFSRTGKKKREGSPSKSGREHHVTKVLTGGQTGKNAEWTKKGMRDPHRGEKGQFRAPTQEKGKNSFYRPQRGGQRSATESAERRKNISGQRVRGVRSVYADRGGGKQQATSHRCRYGGAKGKRKEFPNPREDPGRSVLCWGGKKKKGATASKKRESRKKETGEKKKREAKTLFIKKGP